MEPDATALAQANDACNTAAKVLKRTLGEARKGLQELRQAQAAMNAICHGISVVQIPAPQEGTDASSNEDQEGPRLREAV